jgi:hypothetical protein
VKLTKVPPGSPLQSMIIFATDGGKFSGAPDTATFGFSTAPPPPDGACPTPFAGFPVADGEVVIHNTLP